MQAVNDEPETAKGQFETENGCCAEEERRSESLVCLVDMEALEDKRHHQVKRRTEQKAEREGVGYTGREQLADIVFPAFSQIAG